MKSEIFAALGKIVRPDALITSNTSSIPIMQLAAATDRPERVVGLDFFNPAPVMPLVEIIPCEISSDETVRRAREFAADQLGKTTITAKDRAGFVVNALLIPYLLAAICMADAGLASAEDIDKAMVGGCNHPMGPLALTDLIGLDTTVAVAESMYADTREHLYAPRRCFSGRSRPANSAARAAAVSSATPNARGVAAAGLDGRGPLHRHRLRPGTISICPPTAKPHPVREISRTLSAASSGCSVSWHSFRYARWPR